MSDYEVTLVNDNMQEFYVRFHGPKDSKQITFIYYLLFIYINMINANIQTQYINYYYYYYYYLIYYIYIYLI